MNWSTHSRESEFSEFTLKRVSWRSWSTHSRESEFSEFTLEKVSWRSWSTHSRESEFSEFSEFTAERLSQVTWSGNYRPLLPNIVSENYGSLLQNIRNYRSLLQNIVSELTKSLDSLSPGGVSFWGGFTIKSKDEEGPLWKGGNGTPLKRRKRDSPVVEYLQWKKRAIADRAIFGISDPLFGNLQTCINRKEKSRDNLCSDVCGI